MADTGHAWQMTEMPVQAEQAVDTDRYVSSGWQVRNLGGAFGDQLVGLRLNLGPPAPYEWAADQQKDHQAEDRGHDNEEQPCDGGGRSPVAGHCAERHDLDDQFDEVQ